MSEKSKLFIFHCFLNYDEERKIWVGYCFDSDIIVEAKNFGEATSGIKEVVSNQLHITRPDDNWCCVFHPVPFFVWTNFINDPQIIQKKKKQRGIDFERRNNSQQRLKRRKKMAKKVFLITKIDGNKDKEAYIDGEHMRADELIDMLKDVGISCEITEISLTDIVVFVNMQRQKRGLEGRIGKVQEIISQGNSSTTWQVEKDREGCNMPVEISQ